MQTTFSIGFVDHSGNLAGVATASRYPAVGALTIHARADAGVVITQSVADPGHAVRALPRLAAGDDPASILHDLVRNDSKPEIRQIALLNRSGDTAVFSGDNCFPVVASVRRPGLVALGNMLASDRVPDKMVAAFTRAFREGDKLGPEVERVDRVAHAFIAALKAAETAGGDKRGKQAAALLVVAPGAGYGGGDDRAIDLRVDDHSAPVQELERILEVLLQTRRDETGF